MPNVWETVIYISIVSIFASFYPFEYCLICHFLSSTMISVYNSSPLAAFTANCRINVLKFHYNSLLSKANQLLILECLLSSKRRSWIILLINQELEQKDHFSNVTWWRLHVQLTSFGVLGKTLNCIQYTSEKTIHTCVCCQHQISFLSFLHAPWNNRSARLVMLKIVLCLLHFFIFEYRHFALLGMRSSATGVSTSSTYNLFLSSFPYEES